MTTRLCRCCRGRWNNCGNCGGTCSAGCSQGAVDTGRTAEEKLDRCAEIGAAICARQQEITGLAAERVTLIREIRADTGMSLRAIGARLGISGVRIHQVTAPRRQETP